MTASSPIASGAIGADDDDLVYYPPVSRVIAGGFGTVRPAELAVLGCDLINDEDELIVNDDDEIIGTEA